MNYEIGENTLLVSLLLEAVVNTPRNASSIDLWHMIQDS